MFYYILICANENYSKNYSKDNNELELVSSSRFIIFSNFRNYFSYCLITL